MFQADRVIEHTLFDNAAPINRLGDPRRFCLGNGDREK
jgi:hypothetical protein